MVSGKKLSLTIELKALANRLNFPMPTSSLVMLSKDLDVSTVSHPKPEQVTILHLTGEREHEVRVCGI